MEKGSSRVKQKPLSRTPEEVIRGTFQLGYFVKDQDSTPEKFVFNKTTGLKDTFKK